MVLERIFQNTVWPIAKQGERKEELKLEEWKMTDLTCLAPHVLLTFDDFSRAGPSLAQNIDLDGHAKNALTFSQSLTSEFAQQVAGSQYTDADGTASLSVVTVATADLDGAALWKLADALVQVFSDTNVQRVTIAVALHLPEAKPSNEALGNAYYGSIAANASTPTKVQAFSDSWEIRDQFLTRFLHFARAEQAFTTEFVAVKGYKPGRDGVATREAIDALAKALVAVLGDSVAIDIDTQAAVLDAYKTLSTASQQVNLLYQ